MSYAKPPLLLEEQADLLIRRGLIGDCPVIVARLASVNYYRLSGYWLPFRCHDSENFRPGTTFAAVWDRYVFDRRLRLLVMDAIERVEVTVRSQLAYHHAHTYGAFAYATDPASMPKFDRGRHREFVQRIEEETVRSREVFVNHFRAKYGASHQHLPVWMATEVMTFGSVLSFFRGASHKIKQNVASVFAMPETLFNSWLMTLNAMRNICAHHGRLWNRELGVKPMIPRRDAYPDWHTPENNRVFAVLTICRYCLRCIAAQSRWPDRLRALLAEFPRIPRASMGFPASWEQCPIWTRGAERGGGKEGDAA